MALPEADRKRLDFELGRAFSPAAPVDTAELFAGRQAQLRDVVDAINQRGQHAIIYGERGVGKTSLASILSERLQAAGVTVLAPKVNCDGSDDYSSLWRKVLGEIVLVRDVKGLGLHPHTEKERTSLAANLPKKMTPDIVRRALMGVGQDVTLILIIDEYDRLEVGRTSRLFADTVKVLSDQSVPATVVVVGVADTVDDLIKEHQSIERALVQIHMPRMSRDELTQIVDVRLMKVGMEIEREAVQYISFLSQGLPHYTHLLGLFAARRALSGGVRIVSLVHVEAAVGDAIAKTQQSIRSAHHIATMSPRKENLYGQVLLACALARKDSLGYFAAADIRAPMSQVMRKPYDIPAFSKHLNDFCVPVRGSVLNKIGSRRRFRFRFVNPLMQPFVIMQGLNSGLIDRAALVSAQS